MASVVLQRASRRRGVTIAFACCIFLAVYTARLLGMGHAEIVRSDYLMIQAGGYILAHGQASHLYSSQVQAAVQSALAGGDHTGYLPYNHAPLTAVMTAPISGLNPVTSHLLWSLFQFLLVVLACAFVAIAAPWPQHLPSVAPVAATLVALVGAGTLPMLTEGQDLGMITLGLGVGYAAWRSDRLALGAAAVVFGAAIAKPHLALGIVVFMAGWRSRRVIAGAVAGGALACLLSVMAVGWTTCVAFLDALARSAGAPHSYLLGFTGLFASWLGEGATATVLADIFSVVALASAFAMGIAVRADRSRLGPALIGATLLSLLASPHTFPHDLEPLAPMLVLAVAEATRRAGPGAWPQWAARAVLMLWLLIVISAGADAAGLLPAAVGRVTPLVLLICTAVAARVVWRGPGPTGVRKARYPLEASQPG